MKPICTPKASESSPMVVGKSLVLFVQHLGNVPSFKNSRRLFFTHPKKRKWMDHCIQSFVSQLISASQTGPFGTCQACSKQFVIACAPLDDNWQELEIGRVSCKLTDSETAGATVTIERLS